MRRRRVRDRVRGLLAIVLSATPHFRGKGRVTLLLDRVLTDYGDPSSFVTVGKLNGGHRFTCDLRAWGQKFAFYYGEWESDLIRVAADLYPGGTFVDVGSSLGLYPVCLAEALRRKGGTVLSFEPVPLNVERQLVNIEMNGLADLVTVIPLALGREKGLLPMRVDPVGADNNAFFEGAGDVLVPMTTLDEFLDEHPGGRKGITLMKIDVEGYEPFVISGARRTIERDRPVILAEFCRERMIINGCSIGETWQFLTAIGYRVFRLSGGRLERIDQPADFENLFFVPASLAIPSALTDG